MGSRPGFGFKTNVKDKEFAEEIAESVAKEFNNLTHKDGTLDFGDWSVSYAILEGPNEYFGFSHNGLVFSHCSYNYPKWNKFRERGDKLQGVAEYVNDEFDHIEVQEVMPTIPTS